MMSKYGFAARVAIFLFMSVVSPSLSFCQDRQLPVEELRFDYEEAKLDPFGDQRGPYFHKVYQARSRDGLNFTKVPGVVLDKASVPDIIRLPDGRLFLYAVDGGRRSESGLMVAISENGGRSWQQGSLQFHSKRGLNAGADPEVVLLEDGTLRLYYVVFGGEMSPQPIPPERSDHRSNKILSALSLDGIHFEEEEGIRFEYPQITDPDVVKIGNPWFMYSAQGPRLIAASSRDGLHFKFDKIIRERGSVSNTIPIGNNRWRQYFCDGGIRSAVTHDGLNWIEEEGFRLRADKDEIICDPAPVKIGAHWLLFYKGASKPKFFRRPR